MNKSTQTAANIQTLPHPATYPAPARDSFTSNQINKHYKAVDLLFQVQQTTSNLKVRKERYAELAAGVPESMLDKDFLCVYAITQVESASAELARLTSEYVDLLRSLIEPVAAKQYYTTDLSPENALA